MPGNDSNVVSLLHMNGANNGTTFPDDALGGAGHSWTASGTTKPITDTSQNAFGASGKSAGKFDGSTSYLTTPYSTDFSFGTGDFSVDFLLNFNALPASGGYACFWALRANGDANNFNNFYIYSLSGAYTVYFVALVNGVTKASYYGAWAPTTGVWYHMALVRHTTSLYWFVNGTSKTFTASTGISNNTITIGANDPFIIGRLGGYDLYYFNGWMNDFRVSNVARWTAAFTPLKQAYNGMLLDTGAAWKASSLIQVNNGAAWKDIALIQVNDGSAWKDLR